MGREVGGGFMMGNTCIPVADSCQCMAKPIQKNKIIAEYSYKKKKSKMQQFHFCLLTPKIKISISERKKIIFCFSRLTLSPHRCCQKEVKVRVPSSASVAGLGSREVHVCA